MPAEIYSIAPWFACTVAVWLIVYAIRKHAPYVWEYFEGMGDVGATAARILQGLPSIMLGVWVSAVANGGDIENLWKGAIAGAFAPLLHHVLKASALPYQGANGDA